MERELIEFKERKETPEYTQQSLRKKGKKIMEKI